MERLFREPFGSYAGGAAGGASPPANRPIHVLQKELSDEGAEFWVVHDFLEQLFAPLDAEAIRRAAYACAEILATYEQRPFGEFVLARLKPDSL